MHLFRFEQAESYLHDFPHPLIYFGRDLNYLWVNPAAARLTPHSPQDFPGKTLEMMNLAPVQLRLLLTQAQVTRQAVLYGILELPVPGGADHIYTASVFPVLSDLGEVLRLGCALYETPGHAQLHQTVTRERQNMNNRIGEQPGQLAGLNAELYADITSLTYHVQEPLRRIQDSLGLLDKQYGLGLDDKGRRYLSVARSESDRIAHLTTELTQLQQFLQHEFRPMSVPLRVMVLQARNDLELLFIHRKVHWLVAELPVVWGDPVLLHQALTVLLHNAMKFTRDQAEASIRVWAEDGSGMPTDANRAAGETTVLCIQDNGVGFTPERTEALEQFFGQLHAGRFQGSGLGLAAVQRIMTCHGGRVWVTSQEGVGTTVRLSFPPPVPVPDAPMSAASRHPALSSQTLLGPEALTPGAARSITEVFGAAMQQADTSVIISDPDQNIIYVNPAFTLMTGYSFAEVVGRNPRLLQGSQTDPAARQYMRERLSRGEQVHTLILNHHKDGRPIWFNLHIHPLHEQGQLRYFVSMQEDASERIDQLAKIEWAANHDQLTGLKNRHSLNGVLRKHVQDVRPFALLIFDLDFLKRINDTLGHSVGDQALCRIADLLTSQARPGDEVFRLGGDEFLVILPDVQEEGAQRFAARIQELLRSTEDNAFRMAVSVGFALYPEEEVDMQGLIRRADKRMYRQKIDRRLAGGQDNPV